MHTFFTLSKGCRAFTRTATLWPNTAVNAVILNSGNQKNNLSPKLKMQSSFTESFNHTFNLVP